MGKLGKEEKMGKKEEKLERKGKTWEDSFTLPLPKERAGYVTVKKPTLQKTTHRLMSYSGHQLDIKGKVTLPLKYKCNECDATFDVVQTAGKPPLLSGETNRTYNVQFQKEFPQVKELTAI